MGALDAKCLQHREALCSKVGKVIRRVLVIDMRRKAGVALVEADHPEATLRESRTEGIRPDEARSRVPHDQQDGRPTCLAKDFDMQHQGAAGNEERFGYHGRVLLKFALDKHPYQ